MHANENIPHVYFPLSRVISLVLRMSDGTPVEVAACRPSLVATRRRSSTRSRDGLEQGACECYHAVRTEFERLFGD